MYLVSDNRTQVLIRTSRKRPPQKRILRDGPLEKLMGGRAKYKKNIRARQN